MGDNDWAGPLGGIIGSSISAGTSAMIARKNREFQERMTKHRYQYQMADMRAAGLNPMLAMGQSPPGSPPGAMAQIPDLGSSFAKGTSAWAQKQLAKEQEELAKANVELTGEKKKTEIELQKNARDLRFQRGFQNANSAAQTQATIATTAGIKSDNVSKALQAEIDASAWGRAMGYIGKGTGSLPRIPLKLPKGGNSAKEWEKNLQRHLKRGATHQ